MLVLSLISVVILAGCSGRGSDMSPEEALEYFVTQARSGNLVDYRLTIYFFYPDFLPWLPPANLNDLKQSEFVSIITVGGGWLDMTFGWDVELSNQISVNSLLLVEEGSRMMPRIYYVFETNRGRKIFDVAMWGDNGSIFVNGLEIERNVVFYDIIRPFLPQNAVENMDMLFDR